MTDYRFLFKYFQKHLLKNSIILILLVIYSLAMTGASLSLMNILNALVDQNFHQFTRAALVSISAWVVALSVNYIAKRLIANVLQNVLEHLRRDMIQRIEIMSYQSFNQKEPLNYSAILLTDLNALELKVLNNFYKIIDSSIYFVVSAVALIYLHYSLLVLSLVLAVVMMVLPMMFNRSLNEATSQVTQSEETLLSKAGHWLSGFNTLYDFNQTNVLTNRLAPFVKGLNQAKQHEVKVNEGLNLVMGLFGMFSQLSVIILSGYLSLIQIVPVGALLSTGNLVGVVFSQLQVLSVLIAQFKSAKEVSLKIEEFLEIPVPDGELSTTTSLTRPITIETHNLSYGFNDEAGLSYSDHTFSNLKNYGIVGESGTGKTVFFNLLNGNYSNYKGSILMNGKELKELSPVMLKETIGYIRQDPYIFEGTLKENITLLDSKVTEEQLDQAIDNARLRDLINELPQGLDTLIGPNGKQLSGGQVQRIGIARALVRNYPVLLFDEVTANLDRKNAEKIEEMIQQLPNTLKITISHHITPQNETYYDEIIHF